MLILIEEILSMDDIQLNSQNCVDMVHDINTYVSESERPELFQVKHLTSTLKQTLLKLKDLYEQN